jgi:amino acid transporter
MAKSGLIPRPFAFSPGDHPWGALILGSLLSYAVCLLSWFETSIALNIFPVTVLGAYITYCCQCHSFLRITTKYSSLARSFRSPLGKWGAYYAMTVFSIGALAVIGFSPIPWLAPTAVSALCRRTWAVTGCEPCRLLSPSRVASRHSVKYPAVHPGQEVSSPVLTVARQVTSYVLAVSGWYWLVSRHHQTVSPEEGRVMFQVIV